jgi:putative transposase
MRKSRFTEEKIIAVLTEQERGTGTAEVCRKHGISPATFHKWKAKFGGMDVSEARKLKPLETENGRLKKLLADSTFYSTRMSQIASVARKKRHWKSKIYPLRFRMTITQCRRSDVLGLSCLISRTVRDS